MHLPAKARQNQCAQNKGERMVVRIREPPSSIKLALQLPLADGPKLYVAVEPGPGPMQ
jgi:hypothetical protein